MKILPLLLLVGALYLPESKAFFWDELLDFTPEPHHVRQNDPSSHHDHSVHHHSHKQKQHQHQHHRHSHKHDASQTITPPLETGTHSHESAETRYVYNASSPRSPICPMLYTPVGDRCVAFFTVARVPWSAAKEFCQGIFGDLITFTNVHHFIDLLKYLQDSELDVDLWIGGREDLNDTPKWVWMDDTPMPKGSPYWGIKLDETVPRSRYTLHKNVAYSQAPTPSLRKPHVDRCAAMTSRYFYYITDEWCRLWMSPVCVLREDAEVVMVKGSEESYSGVFLPPDDTSNVLLTKETSTTSSSVASAVWKPVFEGDPKEEEGSGMLPNHLLLSQLGISDEHLFIDQEE